MRNRGSGTLAGLLIGVLCLGSLTACAGGGIERFLGGGSEANRPVVSRQIYLPIENVRTLNPLLSKDEDVYFILKRVYDSLFEPGDGLVAETRIVEDYAYADDGLSLTLRLREGLLWQDGENLTAADVVFSTESYIAYPEGMFAAGVSNIRSASAVKGDPLSLTIRFKSADGAGLERLTFPILPKHLYKNAADLKSRNADFSPVGSGAYRVTAYDPHTKLTLEGNPSYHGTPPENTLVFRVVPSREDALNMLDVNLISYAISREGDRDTLYRDPRVKIKAFPSNEAVWIGFNFRNPTLADKRARTAIALAVDNADIIESCYFNSGSLSDSLYFPGFLNVSKAEDAFPHDENAARERIASLRGTPPAAEETSAPDSPDPEADAENPAASLTFRLLVNGGDASRVSAANLIADALARVGITCVTDAREPDAYVAAYRAGDFDLWLGEAAFGEAYDLRAFLHGGFANPIGYADTRVNGLLDALARGNTPETRKVVFGRLHAILTDEIPYYCVLYKTYGAVAAPAFDGYLNPRFNDVYRGCEDWRSVTE